MKRILQIFLATTLCASAISSCGKDEPTPDDPNKEPIEKPEDDPNKDPEEDPKEDEPSVVLPGENEGSEYDYSVKSIALDATGKFLSGFYQKTDWNNTVTLNYSVSDLGSYLELGNSMNIEISFEPDKIEDGEPFDIASTDIPFTFMIEYVDIKAGDTVKVKIDNTNREGANGTIQLSKNSEGRYNSRFDLSLKAGDVTVKGYYADPLKSRNTIYSTQDGILGTIESATLDITGNPCVLYLSTKAGPAGPDNYDIKGEVSSTEWILGRFMAFSGQGSSLQWIDGKTYDKSTSQSTPFFGGNWRVAELQSIDGGKEVAECTAMLFGNYNQYAYYLGEIKIKS